MIFLDTETVGFTGPIVLLQYAIDDGPIILYEPWLEPVRETVRLIEEIANHPGGVCGFNLSFDWFHLCQMYTTLLRLPQEEYLEDLIEEYAEEEPIARDGPCLKPVSACDIMLWARKGPYQTLMDREDVRIKRVPTPLAQPLANELEKRIKLNPIYFGKKKNKYAPQWTIYDIEDEDGEINPEFKDIAMVFAPNGTLKALATDALKLPPDMTLLFADIDCKFTPVEYGYAPFAKAVGERGNWRGAWPEVIHRHIAHWHTNELARKYATNDVDYTRRLWEFFGRPEPGDDDSELACMVGACRWKGYNVDLNGIKKLRLEAKQRIKDIPTYSANVRKWIMEVLDPIEILAWQNTKQKDELNIQASTKKVIIENMAKLETIHEVCHGEGCGDCKDGMIPHPAAIRAKKVLEAREAMKEIELYDKLLLAGRLHADFNVIGTLSSRMSGAGGLNVQGIKKTKNVRSQFNLAFPPYELNGGDFSAFEVVLAIAVWGDKKLAEVVTSYRTCHKCEGNGCENCKGKGKVKTKIHALFGTYLYPGKTYEEILDSDGAAFDMYTRAKSGLFAVMYGGEDYTLSTRLGVTVEAARIGFEAFLRDFPGVATARRLVFQSFTALTQLGGRGTKVEWSDPADYVEEPITGHRRYFTLENQIIKALYELAQAPPKEWQGIRLKIVRRDREQTVSGAVQSALYAAAFQLQSGNCRAAANHQIQSAGAKICKATQRSIWDLQPSGVHSWIVQPMNIHDELMCPTEPNYTKQVTEKVKNTVESFRKKVPLLAIDWHEGIANWSEKKG